MKCTSLAYAKSRIEGEMRAMLDANGFAGQPIGAAMDHLGKDPRFLYSNDDKAVPSALQEKRSYQYDRARQRALIFHCAKSED